MFRRTDKESVFCYAFFAVQLIAIVILLILLAGNHNITDAALIYSIVSGITLAAVSFIVSFFLKRLAIEKKIFVMLGTTAIFLAVVSMADLVSSGDATFLDTIYKSIQLFVGEFEYTSVYNRPVPPLLNAARFIALFVTFGTIFTIILKQKIFALNIRLFYSDILIISDRNSDYASGLANKFLAGGRKVVLALTESEDAESEITNTDIPTVFINIDTGLETGLRTCNAKKAKTIYLICDNTKDNVLLAKEISRLKADSKKSKKKTKEAAEKAAYTEQTAEALLADYYDVKKERNEKAENKLPDTHICYVHYNTDSERYYYSTDEVFINRNSGFSVYFINLYDIAIRQMISSLNILETVGTPPSDTAGFIKEMDEVCLAVAGSGEILERTVTEIAKICRYNTRYPMIVYHIKFADGSDVENDLIKGRLSEIVKIKEISPSKIKAGKMFFNALFISTVDEKEIAEILQQVFHCDLQDNIGKYSVLTYGNTVEYDILKKNISHLLSPYSQGERKLSGDKSAEVKVSNVKDLIVSVEGFYREYAPTIKQIHEKYQSAFKNNALSDFDSLPELFIVSNILSAIHMDFLDSVLESLKKSAADKNEFIEKALGLTEYLALTEHERWYNERYLQGYDYSKEKDPLYLKNTNLIHWDKLMAEQKDKNTIYALISIVANKKRDVFGEGDYSIDRYSL